MFGRERAAEQRLHGARDARAAFQHGRDLLGDGHLHPETARERDRDRCGGCALHRLPDDAGGRGGGFAVREQLPDARLVIIGSLPTEATT